MICSPTHSDRRKDCPATSILEYPKDEMKAMIVAKFDETYSQDPFDYLQQVRAEQVLPTRERDNTPSRNHDPEM